MSASLSSSVRSRLAEKQTVHQLVRGISSKPKANPAFSFVPSNALPEKPREVGRTEIRGPYYSPFGPRMMQDVLETFGEYVDGVKYSGGTFTLQTLDSLKNMIALAHDHGAYVSTGGFMEKLLSSSNGDKAIIDRYLRTCKDLGFDVIEISSGFLTMPAEDWRNLVDAVVSHGLKAKPEIGIQMGAGGDTSAEELEAIGTRDPSWLVNRAKLFLDAGADTIMIESEGITENVKSYRSDVISSITSNLPNEKVMFEAADPAVFQYYIANYGPKVNMFVDHSQIVQLAAVRRGIWGNNTLFGRVVTYPGQSE